MKYVAIHGHFYQPPRENPWLEETEREESATPFHDWNERIAEECYKPNAAARILDDKGRIAELKNNYEHLSFNFGPTLLRWMERHSKTAYRAILDADRSSHKELGHGNAIAQVYNHVILPLANLRDKHTQIRWGIRDFEHRFKRKPEGMWLAETAVDKETLAALSENDISFTILSPFQAKRFRHLDGSQWTDCEHGEVPTGRAYLYQGHKGRPIHLFFYDGAIAKGIAFDRMLSDSMHLVGSVEHAHRIRHGAKDGEPWLVHTATDGESYGHHFAHGDMALAAAFKRLEASKDTKITNYAAFLAQNPVRAEADIKDVSAWSCAHGVGRWSRDCGCKIGGGSDWNQKWREPLRESLNILRDSLALHYEREMGKLAKDPWAVRDAYIDVVLDPSIAARFAREHTHGHLHRDVTEAELARFLQLLEMQRAALLMFTSCGWFFDDVSGGESIILMKYASRAIDLARITGASDDGEARFLEMLGRAESNIKGPKGERGPNGRELYFDRAKSVGVTTDKVVASHALRTISEGARREQSLYAYTITQHEEVLLKKGAVPCLVGHVSVEDTRTLESADTVYALAHFGGLDFRCSMKPYADAASFAALVESVRKAALLGSTAAMMQSLDDTFGENAYTLKDAFTDLRQAAARTVGADKVKVLDVVGAELLDNHRALLLALRELGVHLPPHVETLASHVLSVAADEFVQELVEKTDDDDDDPNGSADIDFVWKAAASRLRSIADEAHALGVKLEVREGGRLLGDAVMQALADFGETRDDDRAAAAIRLLAACGQLGITPRLWDIQTEHHRLVERALDGDRALRDALKRRTDLVDALDAFGNATFGARLL